MDFLIESISNVAWQNVVMWVIGAVLCLLAFALYGAVPA